MKKILSFFLFFCCFSIIFAQEIKTITIDDAVSLALENNISIKQQKINLDLLQKRNSYSWNSVSPSASVSGNVSPGLEKDSASSWSVSANLSLSLTPSLYTSIQSARLNYENGLISFDNAKRTIELNVRKIFYNLIYTKDSIALQDRNLETAKQRYNSTKERFNKGQVSELDLLTAQLNYESLKPSIESANITYENSIESFKQMLGISPSTEIKLDGNLDKFKEIKADDIKYNLEDLPSIKSLKIDIENAKNSLLATRFSAWGPSISASYTFGVSGNNKSDEARKTNSLSLGFRIPLDGYLPWSSGALSIESQKANLETLELKYKDTVASTELSINTKIKQIKQAQSQLKLLNDNVTLAQKTYNMTLTAYNHGSKDLLTLLNASDNLLKAKINEQAQINTLISAILDLENTLGVPFGTIK